MVRRVLITTLALAVLALPHAVQARSEALIAALRLDETIAVIRQEGVREAAGIAEALFGADVSNGWQATVDRIYESERMEEIFLARFETELARSTDGAIARMTDFFTSDVGRRALGLEISGRRAMLDDSVEAAAEDHLAQLRARSDGRLAQLRRFVEANELVEANVAGALNATIAFQFGLAEGGAYDFEMSEDRILAMARAQEEAIRAETRAWVMSYLALAYRPLSDEALAEYITFSESRAGQVLNRALFAAFDEMFTRLSRDLGLAAGRVLGGEAL